LGGLFFVFPKGKKLKVSVKFHPFVFLCQIKCTSVMQSSWFGLQKQIHILIFILVLVLESFTLLGQKIEILSGGNRVSLRGLSVVSDKLIWASGSNGTVVRSLDSGRHWKWMTVPGYEKRDFRDIEAFDAVTAVIMAVGEPAVILKTLDGGDHWKVAYENSNTGMFLDAMEFWNEQSGIVLGDPQKGKFFIARSFDGGSHWQEVPPEKSPAADSGEACFASSGTNIRPLLLGEACFVSGGTRSRFFWKGGAVNLPLLQGRESQGANSIAVRDWQKHKGENYLVVVGGDFSNDTLSSGNCAVSGDGGKTWFAPLAGPLGYRSCVEFLGKSKMLTCGTSGVDVSRDSGMHWEPVSKEGFHVCRKAKKGKTAFLAGSNGRIARLTWQ
jgi:photosystem II stability/assembly factor-like uncharacterized protein